MPATERQELIDELNKDLELEYAAAVQYVQHASVITGAQSRPIATELVVHSQEEMQHAVALPNRSIFSAVCPPSRWRNVKSLIPCSRCCSRTCGARKLRSSGSEERIALAEKLREYGLRRIIEEILIQEEEHKRDLLTAMDR